MGMLKLIPALFAVLLMAAPCIPKQKEKPRVPALEKVYKPKADEVTTSPVCIAWTNLRAELKTNRVKTIGVCEPTPIQPVPWFPACVYSDGATDAGERVYEKRCYFASTVLVIEWVDTKKSVVDVPTQ